jgi:CubicO group peptidase (beta-lactamase class C family)
MLSDPRVIGIRLDVLQMRISRRTGLRLLAAGTAGATLSDLARASDGGATTSVRSLGVSGHDYAPALAAIVRYAREELTAVGLPGITLSIVDADGFAGIATLGWADIDRRAPVDTTQLFQIGSISKSFAALCVYCLADSGKIDLGAPLSHYLPDAALPLDPILIHQVLSHTAGLPADAPIFPRVPDGRLWTGFAPGSNFSYSNVGFGLLGKLVEKICVKPYPLALRELVIKPLGMHELIEVVQAKDRARYAVGYSPLDVYGPDLTRVPIGQTPWVNRDDAAGSIGTNSDTMALYLRYLISVGRGRGSPLFSDKAAERFATPVTDAPIFGNKARYANGLAVIDLDGHAAFHHTGGMIAFSSSLTVDPVAGVGCFASVNGHMGDYRPSNVTAYACRLMRGIRDGSAPPAPPDPPSLDLIDSANDYIGIYVSQSGDRFELRTRSGRLFILADGSEGRVQAVGEHGLQTDHPRLQSHLMSFERVGGRVVASWWGSSIYGRGTPRPQPATPAEFAAFQGLYVSDGPWIGSASVVAQGSRLVLERYGTLDRERDFWRVKSDEALCERVRFGDYLNGRARRLNISGQDLWRFDSV